MHVQNIVATYDAQRVAPIVDIDRLNKSFGSFHVLRNITLSVQPGEKLVLCGPPNSGKSTLIRCINGLEDYQSGRVTVDGITVTSDPGDLDQIRRRVGMVFSKPNLFPQLTVIENLLFGPGCAGVSTQEELNARAQDVLEQVHAADLKMKYPAALTIGEQQRVAIARALMPRPKVLLFDDPASALEHGAAKDVHDVMLELAKDDCLTMLIVTGEMDLARRIADLIVYIDDGEIVEAAPPREFSRTPRSEPTQRFSEPERPPINEIGDPAGA